MCTSANQTNHSPHFTCCLFERNATIEAFYRRWTWICSWCRLSKLDLETPIVWRIFVNMSIDCFWVHSSLEWSVEPKSKKWMLVPFALLFTGAVTLGVSLVGVLEHIARIIPYPCMRAMWHCPMSTLVASFRYGLHPERDTFLLPLPLVSFRFESCHSSLVHSTLLWFYFWWGFPVHNYLHQCFAINNSINVAQLRWAQHSHRNAGSDAIGEGTNEDNGCCAGESHRESTNWPCRSQLAAALLLLCHWTGMCLLQYFQ